MTHSLLFCLSSLAAPRRPQPTGSPNRPSAVQTPVKQEELVKPAETPAAPSHPETPKSRTVFLLPHPDDDPQAIIDLLLKHPELKLTFLFPPHYFDGEDRRAAIGKFSVLQSSKQIEIGLGLENEPILPLLGDLKLAGEKVSKWGFSFAWPDDVAAQVARASGKYQKRWATLPSGFYPPHFALSEQVVQTLKKFRMNWVIGKPNETWGVQFYGGTALLIPPKPPVVDEMKAGSQIWADRMAAWTLGHPFVVIDTTLLEDSKADAVYLKTLAEKLTKASQPLLLVTGRAFTESLRDEYPLPKNFDGFANDYSDGVSTPQQKRAWAALADARQVINTYQSSGHAKLQRLDAAIEEMCNAESGEFLLALGQGSTSNSFNERNFLATLSNIYRLCDAPVPSHLNTWFATRTWQKAPTKTPENDRPFFVEGPQSLTWNDPKGDDNGAGKYTYPAGNYPKGMFDLRELTVSWTDNDVTFSIGMLEASSKSTAVVPLADIYVDVNRLPDAGSTAPLRKRGNTLILRDAAWEYAVAMCPHVSVLYQAVPGANPRVLGLKTVDNQGKSFSASFSRKLLRGDPRRWRLSIGLLGTENSRRQEEPLPVPILPNAGEKNFGGASSGRLAPFMDLLAPTVDDQVERVNANEAGGPLILPYVESQ